MRVNTLASLSSLFLILWQRILFVNPKLGNRRQGILFPDFPSQWHESFLEYLTQPSCCLSPKPSENLPISSPCIYSYSVIHIKLRKAVEISIAVGTVYEWLEGLELFVLVYKQGQAGTADSLGN